MKKILFICCFIFLAILCFALDPAEGYWFSIDDKTGDVTAGWEIYQVDGMLYGKILSLIETPSDTKAVRCKDTYRGFPLQGKVNQMTITGTPWIFGLSMKSQGKWENGYVIDPESGNIYQCKIIYHQKDGNKFPYETLEIRGEIGLGIGGSQYWRRTTREEAVSLK